MSIQPTKLGLTEPTGVTASNKEINQMWKISCED